MKRFFPYPTRGYVVIFATIISAVIMTITVGFFQYYGSAIRTERSALASTQALALAEAGIDTAVYKLNQNSSYSGESDTALGTGTFSVSIASIDGNTKRVTVTGAVPDTTHPVATKVVQATVSIDSAVVSFRYGVQVGEGGFTMSNGAKVIGNLFANGNISGSGTITGDATVAVGTDPIANQQWATQNSSFNLGDTSARANVAQGVQPSVTASLAKISLNIKKVGNPGDITIKIVTNDNGKPSKTVLASGTIPASLVTTAYGFIEAGLDSTPSLTANTTYWIIAIASVDASNYFVWGLDSNSGYSRGAPKYSSNWNASNPTWTSITGDLDFMWYVTGIPTSISGVTVNGNAWAQSLSNCTIGGTAQYQTTSTCTVTGTSTAGVTPATPAPLPISDAQITEWETAAAAGGTLAGPYSVSGTKTLGPKKIDGNLTVTNGAKLILAGPLWVKGDVTLSNNAILTVASTTGSGGAVIVADVPGSTASKGEVDISNNVAISGNGSANSYPLVVTTNTGAHAIDLSNNATSVLLYAPYGTVEVSNGAGANQVTAKSMELENNATITYVSGLQNASFSNGPGGSWAVVPGTYAITR